MTKYCTENIQSISIIKKYFLLNWHMTGWCNYHCPYCINNKLRCDWIDESFILQEAQKINKFLINSNIQLPISLRLIGGEVTYYNLIKVLDYITKIDKIILVTNLSRDISYFQQLYIYCRQRNINFFLGCSKHEENLNFDNKIIELTKWCKENHFKEPQVTIIADQNFNDDYISFLHNNGVQRIRVSLLREQDQSNKISSDIKEKVYQYNKLYSDNSHGYKQFEVTFKDGSKECFVNASDITNRLENGGFIPDNFYCSSGVTTIAILPNGDVVKNKCDFLRDKVLGNILKDKIILSQEPELCQINKKFNTTARRCSICSGSEFRRKNDH